MTKPTMIRVNLNTRTNPNIKSKTIPAYASNQYQNEA